MVPLGNTLAGRYSTWPETLKGLSSYEKCWKHALLVKAFSVSFSLNKIVGKFFSLSSLKLAIWSLNLSISYNWIWFWRSRSYITIKSWYFSISCCCKSLSMLFISCISLSFFLISLFFSFIRIRLWISLSWSTNSSSSFSFIKYSVFLSAFSNSIISLSYCFNYCWAYSSFSCNIITSFVLSRIIVFVLYIFSYSYCTSF